MNKQKKFNIFMNILFISCLILILSILGYSYFHFTQLKDSLTETEYRTSTFTKKVDTLKQIESEYAKVSSDLGVTEIALPPQKEASKLIKDLEVLANQNGLSLVSIRASGGTKNSGDLNLTQTVKGKNSYELPLELSLEGEYGNFVNYIKNLESYQRLNNVTGFMVSNVSEQGEGNYVSVKLKIIVYLDR